MKEKKENIILKPITSLDDLYEERRKLRILIHREWMKEYMRKKRMKDKDEKNRS